MQESSPYSGAGRADRLLAKLAERASEPRARRMAGMAGLAVLAALLGTSPSAPAQSWASLVSARATDRSGDGGFVLSAPRRGAEHDVVFVARRARPGAPAEQVELHVLDRGRWTGVRDTPSFGVAYEEPHSTAPAADCVAAVEALARAIEAHDPGGLGPVDAIPLSGSERPWLVGWLAGLGGARGAAAALALLATAVALAGLPRGGWLLGACLFGLGLALRATALDLPFVRDQDVQRALTGALPLGELIFGLGLEDRHPPLWFLVLHVFELGGQSPAVLRAPAVLAGALTGPAVLWAHRELTGHERPDAVAAGGALLVTVSAALVQASREVSEIPFFGLVLVATVALVARAERGGDRPALAGVALGHGLVLHTYYLGLFALAGLWLGRRARAEAIPAEGSIRKFALGGTALGLPAVALAARTFFRDLGARQAAALHPDRAWGESSLPGMWHGVRQELTGAVGVAVLGLALIAAAAHPRSRPAAGIAVATALAIALLAPVARVQPYYALAIVPVLVVALAAFDPADWRASRRVAATAVALGAIGASVAAALPATSALYAAEADAVLGRYAHRARQEGFEQLAAVAHYDATLLAYELARAGGQRLDGRDLAETDGTLAAPVSPGVTFLARSHDPGADTGRRAAARLRALAARGPVAVVARDAFPLPEVDSLLSGCQPLDQSPTTRLVRCTSASFPAP